MVGESGGETDSHCAWAWAGSGPTTFHSSANGLIRWNPQLLSLCPIPLTGSSGEKSAGHLG